MDARAENYLGGRIQGAWTGTRSRRPGGRPWRAAGVAAAGPARVARPSGEGMPMAGRFSASQRIRNIAINTGLISFRSALQPRDGRGCKAVIPYQCFKVLPLSGNRQGRRKPSACDPSPCDTGGIDRPEWLVA